MAGTIIGMRGDSFQTPANSSTVMPGFASLPGDVQVDFLVTNYGEPFNVPPQWKPLTIQYPAWQGGTGYNAFKLTAYTRTLTAADSSSQFSFSHTNTMNWEHAMVHMRGVREAPLMVELAPMFNVNLNTTQPTFPLPSLQVGSVGVIMGFGFSQSAGPLIPAGGTGSSPSTYLNNTGLNIFQIYSEAVTVVGNRVMSSGFGTTFGQINFSYLEFRTTSGKKQQMMV